MIFDTTNADDLGDAIAFASNYMRVNRNDYGLQNSDLGVIVIARHRSTGFGYNDAMWAKYGVQMATRAQFTDPKTKQAPKINVFNATDYGQQLTNRGTTLDSLLKQGAVLGVCSVATRGIATAIAEATGGKTDDIFSELASNLVGNARPRGDTLGDDHQGRAAVRPLGDHRCGDPGPRPGARRDDGRHDGHRQPAAGAPEHLR